MIGVGMVGSGVLQQGIPAMAITLEKLSASIDITIYSFIPVSTSKVPGHIRTRYAPAFLPQFLKFYYLLLLFCRDHFKQKYDCLHAQSPFPAGKLALRINSLFKIQWITTIHAGEIAVLPDRDFGDLRKAHLKKITRQVCERSDHLVFMSRWQAKDLEHNLGMHRRVIILPRGIEVEHISLKQLTYPIQLLHVGFYHPVKNQRMLLEAMKILSKKIPCVLKIIGSNYGAAFDDMISDLGLNEIVTCVGALPYSSMKENYQQAHFLLHTSWFEGLPMAAIEAMAYGAVVCGTHIGIMADLSEECCVTVPPGDVDGMVEAIEGLIKDQSRYEAIRHRAYDWAKAHDINWHVAELKKVYFPESR